VTGHSIKAEDYCILGCLVWFGLVARYQEAKFDTLTEFFPVILSFLGYATVLLGEWFEMFQRHYIHLKHQVTLIQCHIVIDSET